MEYIYNLYQILIGAYPVICARCYYDNYLHTECNNGPRNCSICNRSTSYISRKAFTNEQINKIRNEIALENMLNPDSIPIRRDNDNDDTESTMCCHCNYNLIMRHLRNDQQMQIPNCDMSDATICSDCVMRDHSLIHSAYKPETMTLHCTLCDIPILANYSFHNVCLIEYRKKISGEKKKQ
jgi:hypothetical protein